MPKKAFNESSFSQFGGLYTFSTFVILTGLINIHIIQIDKGEDLLDIDTPTPRSSAVISARLLQSLGQPELGKMQTNHNGKNTLYQVSFQELFLSVSF